MLATPGVPDWMQAAAAAAGVAVMVAAGAMGYGGLTADVAHLRSDVADIKADVKSLLKGQK